MSDAKNKPPRPPPKASPARVPLSTGTRLARAELNTDAVEKSPPAGSSAPTRLKVVTVAPGQGSFSDVEIPTSQQRLLRKDPYMGATIDGRYKVEAVLGEGGMGVVYRCSHTIIGKKVAMKVLRADLAREPEVTERFLNEAKAASAIGNPHIIDISDFGQFPDGATYFIMEYLGGTPLSKAIEGGKAMPVSRILDITQQLAEGLAAAHAAGIVHRDLKPDNIFLIDRGGQKDFVKILDFGIAKVSTAGADKLTRAGAVFGTPHYMSPEQAAGTTVDSRGDVYSLGVILYELATGRVPFDADNFMGILTQHMYKAPVPISVLIPDAERVPPGLEAIVLKCLSKRAEDRYQSMEALMADVLRLESGSVPEAVKDMTEHAGGFNVPADYFSRPALPAATLEAPPSLERPSRWPWIAGLGGGALAVIVALVMAGTSSGSEEALVAEKESVQATPVLPEPKPQVPEPAPAPAPAQRRVVVAAEPLDAHVYRGEENLGPSPVMLTLNDGERAVLIARREGYKDATITVDGSAARQIVKLERVAAPIRPRPPAAKPAQKTKKRAGPGGTDIVNPWE